MLSLSVRRAVAQTRTLSSTCGPVISPLSAQILDRAQFKASMERTEILNIELTTMLDKVHLGGGERAVTLHRGRNKMLARERIDKLVDSGSSFMEFSALAGQEVSPIIKGARAHRRQGGSCISTAETVFTRHIFRWIRNSLFLDLQGFV